METKMNEKKPLHLTYWEDECSIDQFKEWCGTDSVHHSSYNSTIKVLARRTSQLGYKSVLDVGAGTGALYDYLKMYNAPLTENYQATEITEKFVKHLEEKGIPAVQCPAQKMPFKDKQFDHTLCIDVINHQTSFENFISELIRVTKFEVIITFFKPFFEDLEYLYFYEDYDLGSQFQISQNETGLYQNRQVDSEGKPILVYAFFSRRKIDNFLDSIPGLAHSWWVGSDKKVCLGICPSDKAFQDHVQSLEDRG